MKSLHSKYVDVNIVYFADISIKCLHYPPSFVPFNADNLERMISNERANYLSCLLFLWCCRGIKTSVNYRAFGSELIPVCGQSARR